MRTTSLRLPRPALLVATLSILALPAVAAAQLDHLGGRGHTRAYNNTRGGADQTNDYDGPNTDFSVSADAGTAFTTGSSNAENGTLHAAATSADNKSDGYVSVAMRQRLTFASINPFAQVPLEMYFHGSVNGSAPPNPYAPSAVYASGTMFVDVYRVGSFDGPVFSKSFQVTTDGSIPSRTAAESFTTMLPVFGVSVYEIVWELDAHASTAYSADFGQTATLFVPQTSGVTMTGTNGFLSQEARPTWAAGATTTTPEPASVALIGAGLAGLAVIVRRRQRA